MSVAVARQVYQTRMVVFGEEHGATRAAFGRFVGAQRGHLTERAGAEAYRAWRRQLGVQGYRNKAWRRWEIHTGRAG